MPRLYTPFVSISLITFHALGAMNDCSPRTLEFIKKSKLYIESVKIHKQEPKCHLFSSHIQLTGSDWTLRTINQFGVDWIAYNRKSKIDIKDPIRIALEGDMSLALHKFGELPIIFKYPEYNVHLSCDKAYLTSSVKIIIFQNNVSQYFYTYGKKGLCARLQNRKDKFDLLLNSSSENSNSHQ